MAKAIREVYGEYLAELGSENRDIVVLDADLSGSTKTKEFAKIYPDRFFNMGIAEQNLYGTAAGMAAVDPKLVPYAAMTATFYTGFGCLVFPSILYFATKAIFG